MKKIMMALVAVALVGSSLTTPEIYAGGKKLPATVSVLNTNEVGSEDFGAIRVWFLAEGDPVPTTKDEADALESYVTFAGVGITRSQQSDNIIVVAADEAAYQALAGSDSFAAGENYNALAISLAQGDVWTEVRDSEKKGGVPVIEETDPPFDPPF